MKEITINAALVLQRAIRERLNELKELRTTVAKKESWFHAKDDKKVIEPTYDVKLVDKKCTELENFLLKMDTAIKLSNSTTKISMDFDTEQLLAPIQ